MFVVWRSIKLNYDRRSVEKSVLVSGDQFFVLLVIFFRQLHVCCFVVPSLTRGRVCNLLYNCVWALPEQSRLGRSVAELTAIFYCLNWDSPNLEGQVPVFISPRNRVSQIYPGHWVYEDQWINKTEWNVYTAESSVQYEMWSREALCNSLNFAKRLFERFYSPGPSVKRAPLPQYIPHVMAGWH
jgi:hypothetical protein